jgi:peptide/nickel transport system substrate-binding protein
MSAFNRGDDLERVIRSDASDTEKLAELTRRNFLIRSGGVAAAAAGLSGGLASSALAATRRASAAAAPTLTIASSGAWQGFDTLNLAYIANGPSMELLSACAGTLVQVFLPPALKAAQKAAATGKLNGTPALAKSWTVSPDGTTYTFHLQPHAVSGYGNPLVAEDIIWTIERNLSVPTSVTAFLLGLGLITSPSQVTAINNKTVQIKLPAAPPAYFLQILGLVWLSIYDSTEVKKHATPSDQYAGAWLTTNIAGHGKYKIQSTVTNQSAVLVPNPGFWGAKSQFSKIVQEGVNDQSSRLQLLLTGSAQYAEELTALQLTQVKKNKATAETTFTSTRVAFLVMDNTKPPFNSAAVRHGIAMAIPYNEILSSVYKGFALPWKSAFIPWFQGSSDKYWKYDTNPKEAAKLLKSVKGQSVTLTYVEGFGSGQLIAILVQQALNNAGLNCQLQGLLRAEADKLKVTFQIPFFVDDSDSPAVPHPLYNLQYLYTTKAFQNMARYSNSQIDALAAQLEKIPAKNLAAQNKVIDKCNKILMADLPYIPIAYTGTFGAESKKVSHVGGDEVGLVYIPSLTPAA